MKTVFGKTEEVAAIWAAQSQEEARTGSNTRCRGPVLSSYGTHIARIVDSKEGKVALVSHDTYSGTTAVVIGQARGAAFRRGLATFRVKTLDVVTDGHEENFALFGRRIGEEIDKIGKAVRWDTAAGYRREALRLIGEASMYARTFGLRWSWRGSNPLTAAGKDQELGL